MSYSKVGSVHVNSIYMESSDRGFKEIITLNYTPDALNI